MKKLFSAMAVLATTALAAGELEFTYTNSYDGSEQLALGYVPQSYSPEQAVPLVLLAHSAGCDRTQARNLGYYETAEKENFIVVCPELHGEYNPGQTSFAALPAQYDMLDAMHYMLEHYNIDRTRIYVDGRSMGGMMAALLGLKHPDKFAAVMAGQGIYEMKDWGGDWVREFGGTIEEKPFAYARRSAINFARNGRYLPVFLWHGTNDTWVPVEQADNFFDELKKFNKYQTPVFYRVASSHCEMNYPPQWIYDQLKTYQNVPENGFDCSSRFFRELDLITDEDGEIFYLGFKKANPDEFIELQAVLDDEGALVIRSVNAAEITVNEAEIPFPVTSVTVDPGVKLQRLPRPARK